MEPTASNASQHSVAATLRLLGEFVAVRSWPRITRLSVKQDCNLLRIPH